MGRWPNIASKTIQTLFVTHSKKRAARRRKAAKKDSVIVTCIHMMQVGLSHFLGPANLKETGVAHR
jgi:hypothetical protein